MSFSSTSTSLTYEPRAAGRERDWEFAREAIGHGTVDPDELLRRIEDLPLPEAQRAWIAHLLGAIIAESG